MATRLYAIAPGSPFVITSVVEGVGAACSSASINLTIDLATNLVTGAGGVARGISREEVIKAIETLKAYLMSDTWPPA